MLLDVVKLQHGNRHIQSPVLAVIKRAGVQHQVRNPSYFRLVLLSVSPLRQHASVVVLVQGT